MYTKQLSAVKDLLESKGRDAINFVRKIPIPCCVTNKHGLFEQVNDAYCHIYGYRRDEMIGQHFTMVVPKDSREYLTELHDLFMGRKYELQSEFTVQNKKGELRKIMANAAYVVDAAMNPYKLTFLLDITEKHSEVQILQRTISKLKENLQTRELAEGILFHDIRKPLASIIGLTGLIGEPPFDEEKIKLYRMIPQLARKAMHMVEAYGGIHRMEQGVFEPELTQYDLVPQVKQLFEYLKPEAGQKSVTFQLDIEPSDSKFMVKADQLYIELMLENLLTNALQASPMKKSVRVELRQEENMNRIRIYNLGVIPEQIRGQFFEKYVTAGKTKGTGLGTYIVRLIVESHQGEVGFETSEEQGTCLEVSLPIA